MSQQQRSRSQPEGRTSLARLFFTSRHSFRQEDADKATNSGTPRSVIVPSQPQVPTVITSANVSVRPSRLSSRTLRKNQWRLFKHTAFFSRSNSIKKSSGDTEDHVQRLLPKLTLRHPSVDDSAVPLHVDIEETEATLIMRSGRTWSNCDSYRSRSGERGDSHESSGFADSRDDDSDLPTCTTAPVSPCVPLSARSSVSEGWKYSQRLLWKLKPRYMNFSHASSASSSIDSAWRSVDSTTWKSTDGSEIHLKGSRLERLSEIERQALQVIAIQRLNRLLPGVQIGKPKDPIPTLRQKRQKFLKARGTLNVCETSRRASGSSTDDERKVFGISLLAAVENDRRLDSELRCRSLDESDPNACFNVPVRKRFSKEKVKSVVRSEPEILKALDERKPLYSKKEDNTPRKLPSGAHSGSASPLVSRSVMHQPPVKNESFSENLLTAQSAFEGISSYASLQQRCARKCHLTSGSSASSSIERSLCREESSDAHSLNVPRIVADCTEFLRKNGLNTVGLFRIAGSAKRCRQLRTALERSSTPNLPLLERATPHDVATLLKEYFRDLPEPLLSKEYYQGYITAAKLGVEDRIECIRMLFALLPQANVDTLFVLLNFLREVAANASDQLNECGEVIRQGNKMDARNLATIFAPSILRTDHAKLHKTLIDNDAQVSVVETMIENVDNVFMISRDMQSRIFTKLRETDPDGLDRILNHLSRCEQVEPVQPSSPSPFAAMPEEEFIVTNNCNSSAVENPSSHSWIEVSSSNRSRSWPFPLSRSPRLPRFFHSDSDHAYSDHGKTEREEVGYGESATASSRLIGAENMKNTIDAAASVVPIDRSGARRRLRSVVRVLTTARLRVRKAPSTQT
uniref:Rho-GAP domain-containing protein n=1 Tax=Parascaris univalens TaxID=6257 RepID=A0A915C0Q7_PARUN